MAEKIKIQDDFSPLEQAFGRFIASLAGEPEHTLLATAGKLVCRELRFGNSCCDLAAHAGSGGPLPEIGKTVAYLLRPELRTVVGDGKSANTPLVLEDGKLYLKKYRDYEAITAKQLSILDFKVITGGPGTGKTTRARQILEELKGKDPELEITLCAPTGKAQARLKESLGNSPLASEAKCGTLHAVLGYLPNATTFRHNRANPLPCDVLLIDEVSMVSLPMMARTLEALRNDCKLFLLGDKDQLSSVEPGSVLADICDSFPEKITELTQNHRFTSDSNIGRIAGLIRQNSPEAAAVLCDCREEDFFRRPLPDKSALKIHLQRLFAEKCLDFEGENYSLSQLRFVIRSGHPDKLAIAFAMVKQFKILAPMNAGRFGVDSLNALAMELLGFSRLNEPGLPVMVRENDYRLRLFNGDIGIVGDDGRAYFEDSEGEETFRHFSLSELPEHVPVLAMTVSKSQGSGFKNTAIVLPPDDCELLTRELVYTAITRAEKRVILWADDDIIRKSLARRTRRQSGLVERITKLSP